MKLRKILLAIAGLALMLNASAQKSKRYYVTKPFGMMELVSRIKAVLRRSGVKTEEAEELVVGQIRLNKKKHEVYAAGVDVTLTLKEFELLRMLMENRGCYR